ncbi:MAG: UDP-N-acetylmuramoyl-L-alanyl-D-glutamate--2,6-diaminopimelate ligase [Candidatus Aquilonibacter sp.]
MTEHVIELRSLLRRLPASTEIAGDANRAIRAVTVDSRTASEGALFVALRGERQDGHAFVAQAIANGATAVVVETGRAVDAGDATVVFVPNSRRALSGIAAMFYGDPSHALSVAGITGTNGKTTVSRMVGAICNAAGKPCGMIGTVGAEFAERTWPLANTTPLPPELHAILAEMRDAGAQAVAMEVSSHALALDRVDDVRFRLAALTNVTRDHLDFHQTIEAYAAAKHRLFTMAEAVVLNIDDEHGARWASELARRQPMLTYGLRVGADIVPSKIETSANGSRFELDGTTFSISLPGRFNVSNALAAIGVARTLGVDDAACAHGLASLKRVAGRMEHVGVADVDVVVDYAHTPDALEHALRALRETTVHHLSVVFGCGGDRDRGKRPEMGRVAAAIADRIYITSDNPRTEDAAAIAHDIEAGIGGHVYAVELDRRAAIERAIADAHPGDVVLIAGKGHENYQIVGDQTLSFDDVSVARAAILRRGTPA